MCLCVCVNVDNTQLECEQGKRGQRRRQRQRRPQSKRRPGRGRRGDSDEIYTRCLVFFFRLSQARPNFWSLHTLCYYLNAAYGHRLLATLDPLWHPRRFLLGESLLSWHLMQFVSLYVYVCVCVCVSVCFFVGVYVCGCVCMFSIKVI